MHALYIIKRVLMVKHSLQCNVLRPVSLLVWATSGSVTHEFLVAATRKKERDAKAQRWLLGQKCIRQVHAANKSACCQIIQLLQYLSQ